MKKFENSFGAIVELKQLGFSVVSARVILPNNVCFYDARRLAASIMECLVTDAFIDVHPLDDGSFILCKPSASTASRELTLSSCVCQGPQPVNFSIGISFDNSVERDFFVHLDHCFDSRHDYFVNNSRVIDLRGTISVEVDDHEACED